LERYRWRVLILCSIGMFMGTLVTTVVAVALPVLGPALQLSYSEALWVQAAYVLTMSVVLIPVGRVADRRGLMRFYLIGVGIFAVFSIACSLAFSAPFLIVARCLQGGGAAFTAATSSALVTVAFPPNERGRGLGLNAMAGYVGLMAGPPIGGLIVSHASWRWIFLINVPLAIASLVLGWFLLGAERRDREAALERRPTVGASLDWPGTVLLALVLVTLLVPLIFVPFWGWLSPLTLGLLSGFVVLFVTFLMVEGRVRDPVLNLDLVRKNRVFAAGTTAALLNYASVYGVTTFTAVFLEISQGYSAQSTGLFMLTQPVFMAGLSPLFGRMSDRIGSRAPATAGMLVAAAGTAQLGILPTPAPAWRVIVALAVVGIGMAAFSAPNTSSVMGSVQRSQLSLASGFLGTMRTAGQGISIALLGAVAASGLGATGGRVLLLGEKASEAAAESFSSGFRTAMLVAAGLAVVGALISLVRGPRPE
jgi:EmrB/QacA subfamily drug resistance transporter